MNTTLLLAGTVGLAASVFAQPSPHSLPPLEIRSPAATPLPPATLPDAPGIANQARELSKSLDDLPGVALRTQGGHAGEPIIRGLGWERVVTRYNGLNLHGACPSRMDPPVNLFSAESLDAVRIEFGPASVTEGPVPLGGRVLLEDRLHLGNGETRTPAVTATGGADSTGKARSGSLRAETATRDNAFRVEGSLEKSGEYLAADGTRVPANRESDKASASWTQRLGPPLILELGARWIHDRDIDYIALPMDSRYAKTGLATGRLSWTPESGSPAGLTLHVGYGETDHLMDNRDKANRGKVEASTPSLAENSTVGLLGRWTVGAGELRTGMDASRLDRDALRTRTMKKTGMTFRDPVWPDLRQDQIGAYAEWESSRDETTRLRAGVRIDRFEQDAGKGDAVIVPGPGVGKTTVADAWSRVGGSDPGVESTTDTPFAATLLLERDLGKAWRGRLGLSRIEAVPNLTQRYLSFGPVPGGYGIGTPSLDPEEKWEIELRTDGAVGNHHLGAAVFAARVHDYLLPTTVAMLDVDGDGRVDRVKGTRNEDAELYGAEAAARFHLAESLSLPASLSFVRAEQVDSGTPLPVIPPLELKAALRWERKGDRHPFAEIGIRFAARQDRIDPAFGEDETPSFALVHLRGGLDVASGWRLEAGIENLFNETYHEHLAREALLPEGDLRPGDEVPGPGRGVHLALRAEW